jgi:hypothetical protein
MKQALGSKPIEPKFREMMNELARGIDRILNGDKRPKENGFILMMFKFGGDEGHRCNYISNADRADVIALLKEQLRYFEGAPEIEGGSA